MSQTNRFSFDNLRRLSSFGKKSHDTIKAPSLSAISESQVSSSGGESLIIAIPEIDTLSSKYTWPDLDNKCWMQSVLPDILGQATTLTFEPLLTSDAFTWQTLIEWGDLLVEELLLYSRSKSNFGSRALFFVGHGFGGLVIKRAVNILCERQNDLFFQGIFSRITGIIFFGTPHPALHDPRDLNKIQTLLKAVRRTGQSTTTATSDILVTAHISQQFAILDVDAAILSVYETKTSKTTQSILSSRQILVDRYLCETTAKRERLLGSYRSHRKICCLQNVVLQAELKSFVALALELQQPRSRRAHTPPVEDGSIKSAALVESSSLRSLDIHGLTNPGRTSNHSAGNATHFRKPSNNLRQISGQPASQANLPCYMLAPRERPGTFFGRQAELKVLAKALAPATDTKHQIRNFAICGVGGVGKTELAAEFVDSHQNSFDAIFWLHAADTSTLANDFCGVATRLGLTADNEVIAHQIIAKNLVLRWLEECHSSSHKWLLVFDNVSNIYQLKDYWPKSGAGSILVTSRDPLAKLAALHPNNDGFDLQPLRTEEAALWLRQLTGYDQSDDDIGKSREIVEKLSNLPLAISQVGVAILRQGLTFLEFLEYYTQERFRAQIYQSQHYRVSTTIWTTFATNHLSSSATALLHMVSLLNPESIQESLFERIPSLAGLPDQDILRDFPRSALDFLNARTELLKASILYRSAEQREVSMHRIVQDSTISSLSPKQLMSLFEFGIRLLAGFWPKDDYDWNTTTWKLCEPLYVHIDHLCTVYNKNQTLQDSDQYNHDFGKLVAGAGWYQFERGGAFESLAMYELAETVLGKRPILDQLALAYVHWVKAELICWIGESEAGLSEAYKMLELVRDMDFSDNRLDSIALPRAYHQVGETLIANRRFEEALQFEERALQLHYEISGWDTDYERIIAPVCNKCLCLWNIGGENNYSEASNILQDIIAVRAQLFGPDDTVTVKTGWLLYELANIRVAQGLEEEALVLYNRVYEQYLKSFGRLHFRTAAVLTKIGIRQYHKGEYRDGHKRISDALDIYSYNSHHTAEILWSLLWLSRVLRFFDRTLAETVSDDLQRQLLEFSIKVGRRVKDDEILQFLPAWAM